MDMVKANSNIGTGNTEIVLSTIFWIFTKMMKDNISESSKAIKDEQAKTAIMLALDILTKDMDRKVDDSIDEEQEKYTLALSIINFLQFVSEEDQTKHILAKQSKFLKPILMAEQENLGSNMFLKIPIEIETTALGSRLKSLIELLTGPTCLKPYTYISFRVLHAMANLLQFEKAENKMNNYINANKIEAELFIYYNNDLKK